MECFAIAGHGMRSKHLQLNVRPSPTSVHPPTHCFLPSTMLTATAPTLSWFILTLTAEDAPSPARLCFLLRHNIRNPLSRLVLLSLSSSHSRTYSLIAEDNNSASLMGVGRPINCQTSLGCIYYLWPPAENAPSSAVLCCVFGA